MLKREKKYWDLLYKQAEIVEDFLKKKRSKKTIADIHYLNFFNLDEFDDAYFSFSWWRKVYFITDEIQNLAKKYDQAEIKFSKDWDWDEFFVFFQSFEKEFWTVIKKYFSEIYRNRDPYWSFLAVGNFFADECRKLICIIVDSESDVWSFFATRFAERLSAHRKKIGFKVYEKIAKTLVKKEDINYKYLKSFCLSYHKQIPKLKANYNIKIFKIFWSNISKIWDNKINLKLIEWLFN